MLCWNQITLTFVNSALKLNMRAEERGGGGDTVFVITEF